MSYLAPGADKRPDMEKQLDVAVYALSLLAGDETGRLLREAAKACHLPESIVFGLA